MITSLYFGCNRYPRIKQFNKLFDELVEDHEKSILVLIPSSILCLVLPDNRLMENGEPIEELLCPKTYILK